VLLWAVLPAFDAKTSPPAGHLLGELLPIVAVISGVLDPEQLMDSMKLLAERKMEQAAAAQATAGQSLIAQV